MKIVSFASIIAPVFGVKFDRNGVQQCDIVRGCGNVVAAESWTLADENDNKGFCGGDVHSGEWNCDFKTSDTRAVFQCFDFCKGHKFCAFDAHAKGTVNGYRCCQRSNVCHSKQDGGSRQYRIYTTEPAPTSSGGRCGSVSLEQGKNVKGDCGEAPGGRSDLGGCASDDDCQSKCEAKADCMGYVDMSARGWGYQLKNYVGQNCVESFSGFVLKKCSGGSHGRLKKVTKKPTPTPTKSPTESPTERCNANNCMNWSCLDWCECYDESQVDIYNSFDGCKDDNEDTCVCFDKDEHELNGERHRKINYNQDAVDAGEARFVEGTKIHMATKQNHYQEAGAKAGKADKGNTKKPVASSTAPTTTSGLNAQGGYYQHCPKLDKPIIDTQCKGLHRAGLQYDTSNKCEKVCCEDDWCKTWEFHAEHGCWLSNKACMHSGVTKRSSDGAWVGKSPGWSGYSSMYGITL
jgi:hypothetical protein